MLLTPTKLGSCGLLNPFLGRFAGWGRGTRVAWMATRVG